MNWDRLGGQWHQQKGEVKAKWAKLIDDDLKYVSGKKEALIGKLQEHYGVMRTEAERQVDAWIKKLATERVPSKGK